MTATDPGLRLLRLRQQLGLTVREMAAEIGVTSGAVTMWEGKRRPVPLTVQKVIEIYEEAIDEELAFRNREVMLRKLSDDWASRLVVMFGKGAHSRKRSSIKDRLEALLSEIMRNELSQDRIKRNIQIAIFNRIVRAASQTKGLPMKAVQLMSYMNPAMAIEARNALEEIHQLQYPLAPTVVSRIVADSLGAAPTKVFAEWSAEPFAVASIGQVHLARLKTGERVAVKVQYPGVRESLKSDFKALDFLGDVASFFSADVRQILGELQEIVINETDYFKEMDYLESFAELFKDDPRILVPKVHRRFSNWNIITMDYLEGLHLRDFKSASEEERRMAAETIAKFATVTSFQSGMVNTDAHAGNFIFCGGGRVGFIDFGRTAKVELNGSFAQRDLLKAVILKDREMARRVAEHLPMIKDPKTFPFDEFWDFFLEQQSHLHAGKFRFTRDYISRTLEAAKDSKIRKELKMTLEMIWVTAVSFGVWGILADLDVEVDYGKISLGILSEPENEGSGSVSCEARIQA